MPLMQVPYRLQSAAVRQPQSLGAAAVVALLGLGAQSCEEQQASELQGRPVATEPSLQVAVWSDAGEIGGGPVCV